MSRQHQDRILEAALAQELAGLASIHIGQADIEDDHVEMIFAHLVDGGLRTGGLAHREFLMERKLLEQRFAKNRIVVDDQDMSRRAQA